MHCSLIFRCVVVSSSGIEIILNLMTKISIYVYVPSIVLIIPSTTITYNNTHVEDVRTYICTAMWCKCTDIDVRTYDVRTCETCRLKDNQFNDKIVTHDISPRLALVNYK